MPNPAEAAARFQGAHALAVLTGAGLSADSGIPVFRGPGGLWRTYRAEDLATPAAYARDPHLVWEWYAMRFEVAATAQPNAAHHALTRLEARGAQLVTQNVDGLQQRAGAKAVLELHGTLTHSRCEVCAHRDALAVGFPIPPACSACGSRARPDVVWFGETLPQAALDGAAQAFGTCDVALVIGTSGLVEPAASLGRLAKRAGAYVIEVNPAPTPLTPLVDAWLEAGAVAGMATLVGND